MTTDAVEEDPFAASGDVTEEQRTEEPIVAISPETVPDTFCTFVAGRRAIGDSDQAESLLQQLVDAGYGSWTSVPSGDQGGRPTREFTLFAAAQTD